MAEPHPSARRRALEEFTARARSVARAGILDAAAVEALAALRAAGIDVLVLKGAAIQAALYGAGEHRGYFDTDLLVAPRALERAEDALRALGYVNAVEAAGLDPFPDDPHGVQWTRMSADAGPTAIDLHWRLPRCGAAPEVVWERLWERRAPLELAGYRTSALDPGGLALHLAIHAAQHGPQDRKAIADLTRGLGRWDDGVWRDAASLAGELGAIDAFAAGLLAAPGGDALAARIGLDGGEAPREPLGRRDEQPRGVFPLLALAEARGWRARARVLRRALLPPRNWIVYELGWPRRGGAWLLAGYVVHIIRAPLWAARAWRFGRRRGRFSSRRSRRAT